MKTIFLLITISVITFIAFLTLLIIGLVNRKKKLVWISVVLFFVLIGLAAWTSHTLFSKAFNKMNEFSEIFKPRTDEEIYEALFQKKENDCIEIISFSDQIIPKIDYAIRLHIKTCPEELNRILSLREYSHEKVIYIDSMSNSKLSFDENMDGFNPSTLGDTILVFEYSSEDHRNIQNIWSNLDSSEIFVRDVFD